MSEKKDDKVPPAQPAEKPKQSGSSDEKPKPPPSAPLKRKLGDRQQRRHEKK